MRGKLALTLALTAAIGGGLAAPASGGDQKIYAVQDCGEPKVKPKRIVFACADFGLYANAVSYTHLTLPTTPYV